MRPLELRLAGFRSYRVERVVDFRDLDIVAIIGDTGAGKSSLLEAMTWALYGASTWSQRSTSELLAHGAKRMTVALEFEAADERWRVTRTYARSGTGSAQLECLSNAGVAKVDGVRQVQPEIERILGLSYDVFCSCVLLPQGKFERLLKATPGEKTDTLRSILRLELLAEARLVAERQAGIVAERERELIAARGRFREDPAADAARAEASVVVLRPQVERLTRVATRVEELAETARGHTEDERRATADADRLAARRGAPADALRALEAQAVESLAAVAEAREARDAAVIRRAETDAAVDRARELGMDAATLAGVEARLRSLDASLERWSQLEGRLRSAEAAVAAAAEAVEAARISRESTAAALTAHDSAIATASARANEAASAHAALVEAVRELDRAQGIERDANGRLDFASAQAKAADAACDAAAAALEAAERELSATRATLDERRRADAAAHVAAGCAPGDACPVCARALPHDFAPAPALDLEEVEAGLVAAEARFRTAATGDRDAQVDARAAGAALVAAQTEASAADDAVAAASAAVAALSHVGEGEDPAGAVARLAQDATVARSEVDRLTASRAELDTADRAASAQLAKAEAGHDAQRQQLERFGDEHAGLGVDLGEMLSALPSLCGLPATVDALSSADVAAASQRVAARAAEAADLTRDQEAARTAAEEAARQLAGLELAHQREVVTPVTAERAALMRLLQELPADRRGDLGDPPDGHDVHALARCAERVEGLVDSHVAALRARAIQARAARESAEREARDALSGADMPDEVTLRGRLDDLRARLLAAEREHDAAAAQIDDAARLSELVARAAEIRAGFSALKDALNDGAFVRYVVQRRQRALLAHASRVLEEITGRYAFTDDFRILDRESGLPRSPDTLSGGETFIASLALALGLVEVAGRSGGDLRALFLDEGFGTLDATILDTALTALQERARAGRLIGIISHVPTVAERIDTVLEVRSAVEGSTVEVLSRAERDARLLDAADAAVAGIAS